MGSSSKHRAASPKPALGTDDSLCWAATWQAAVNSAMPPAVHNSATTGNGSHVSAPNIAAASGG